MARHQDSREGQEPDLRVLLADDDASEAFAIATALRGFGVGVDRAATGDTALAMALHAPYSAVLVAESLPGRDAGILCGRLRERGSASMIVIIGDGVVPDAGALAALGADDWVRRPVDPAHLAERLRRRGDSGGGHSKQ